MLHTSLSYNSLLNFLFFLKNSSILNFCFVSANFYLNMNSVFIPDVNRKLDVYMTYFHIYIYDEQYNPD